jgi:hypothetical protein
MYDSQWSERTAAAALLLGVIVAMLGLGLALSFRAHVVGAILIAVGGAIGVAAYLTYRF